MGIFLKVFSFSSDIYPGLELLDHLVVLGLPWCPVVKNPPANAGDAGSIPGLGRSPGEENGNPFQYSCLGNAMAVEPGRL